MTPEQFKHYNKIKEEVLKIEEQIVKNLIDAGKMSIREEIKLIEIRGNNIYIETFTYYQGDYDSYDYSYPFEVLSSAETIQEYDREKERIKLLEVTEIRKKLEEIRLKREQENKLKEIENEKKLLKTLLEKYGSNP
jgi:hypothetical protein